MKDFKTYLRETRNEQKQQPIDENAALAMLLLPVAMNLFPKVFSLGWNTAGAIGKGIGKLWDMNQKLRAKSADKKDAKKVSKEDAELQKALLDFDPDDPATADRIEQIESDIKKRRDPKQYIKDLQAKVKSKTDKLKKLMRLLLRPTKLLRLKKQLMLLKQQKAMHQLRN